MKALGSIFHEANSRAVGGFRDAEWTCNARQQVKKVPPKFEELQRLLASSSMDEEPQVRVWDRQLASILIMCRYPLTLWAYIAVGCTLACCRA